MKLIQLYQLRSFNPVVFRASKSPTIYSCAAFLRRSYGPLARALAWQRNDSGNLIIAIAYFARLHAIPSCKDHYRVHDYYSARPPTIAQLVMDRKEYPWDARKGCKTGVEKRCAPRVMIVASLTRVYGCSEILNAV